MAISIWMLYCSSWAVSLTRARWMQQICHCNLAPCIFFKQFFTAFLECLSFSLCFAAIGEYPTVGWHPVSEYPEGDCDWQHTKPLHSFSATDGRHWRGQCGEMPTGMNCIYMSGQIVHLLYYIEAHQFSWPRLSVLPVKCVLLLPPGGGMFPCALVQQSEGSADSPTARELVPVYEALGQFTLPLQAYSLWCGQEECQVHLFYTSESIKSLFSVTWFSSCSAWHLQRQSSVNVSEGDLKQKYFSVFTGNYSIIFQSLHLKKKKKKAYIYSI